MQGSWRDMILLIAAVALSVQAALGEVRLVEPADGTVVPLLTEAQKAYVCLPRAERIKKFADEHFRQKEMGLPVEKAGEDERRAYWPKTVKLAWTAKPGTRAEVSVRDVKKDVQVYSATTTKAVTYVDNLEIAADYKWTVTADGETASAMFRTEDLAPRLIRFPGVPNVRDLGGRIGLGGRRIRQGMVIRSAGLNENANSVWFTKDELRASGKLDELEKKAAAVKPRLEQLLAWQKDPKNFDREDSEFKDWCKRHPSGLPAKFLKSRVDAAKKVVAQATDPKVEKEKRPGWSRVQDAKGEYIRSRFGIRTEIDLRSDRECYGMTGSPLGPTVRWVHVSSCAYGQMQSKGGRAAFTEVFKVFLDPANYPIDFHCIAGQDRTGAVAFILNALLGVDEDQLYLDWEETGFWNRHHQFCHERLFDGLVKGFADNFPAQTLRESVENYVLSCGFAKKDIETFRGIMLEPAMEKTESSRCFSISERP